MVVESNILLFVSRKYQNGGHLQLQTLGPEEIEDCNFIDSNKLLVEIRACKCFIKNHGNLKGWIRSLLDDALVDPLKTLQFLEETRLIGTMPEMTHCSRQSMSSQGMKTSPRMIPPKTKASKKKADSDANLLSAILTETDATQDINTETAKSTITASCRGSSADEGIGGLTRAQTESEDDGDDFIIQRSTLMMMKQHMKWILQLKMDTFDPIVHYPPLMFHSLDDEDSDNEVEGIREEAQAENQQFLDSIDEGMKKVIKEQVKSEVSKITPQIEKFYGRPRLQIYGHIKWIDDLVAQSQCGVKSDSQLRQYCSLGNLTLGARSEDNYMHLRGPQGNQLVSSTQKKILIVSKRFEIVANAKTLHLDCDQCTLGCDILFTSSKKGDFPQTSDI
ncbi:hypothetical protein Tco_0939517 [Tanacetum coccineum]|uniref:Uncharacterized protein n=1 Tax=Tanacetum coccineum TaxID=301880 RepID=A0ABQ5DL19_9ASTR